MQDDFIVHNQFQESLSRYKRHDPHLRRIQAGPFIYFSSLLEENIFFTPGIYLVTGGRQVGKTTFLKQFILKLLTKHKTNSENILFLTGELIDTHHILRRIVQDFYHHKKSLQYLFIDEVNYIPDWDKSIKYLADAGLLDHMSVILTGSDSHIIRTAMQRFAGRRGRSAKVDFEFSPLSFKEFVCLKNPRLIASCQDIVKTPITQPIGDYEKIHQKLTKCFREYLFHGGYLPAMIDYTKHNTIEQGVMNTYVQWIIGDMLKFKKSENYLFEILRGIKTTYNSQISWNGLGKHLSIEHHKTVSDYCQLLESMHVIHILQAFLEHKMTGAPKKNRKIYFRDPFIDHSVTCFLNMQTSFDMIKELMNNNATAAPYVEAVVIDHCKRWTPTYYIKGTKGEVDVALVQNNKYYPIEIKWTDQIRAADIKQIQCYENGIILTPMDKNKILGKNIIVPLVRFLIHVSDRQFNL